MTHERLYHHDLLKRKSLEELLFIIIELEEIHMAAIDDLNSSISQLAADVSALIQKVQATDQTPAIQAAQAQVDGIDASVKAAVTPPPPPAP